MEKYEEISEWIDSIIINARCFGMSAENTRKKVLAALTEKFAELNEIEKFNSSLINH